MASKERNDQGAQTMEGSRERESHSLSHSYKTVMTETSGVLPFGSQVKSTLT